MHFGLQKLKYYTLNGDIFRYENPWNGGIFHGEKSFERGLSHCNFRAWEYQVNENKPPGNQRWHTSPRKAYNTQLARPV